MDNIFVYEVALPDAIREAVTPCCDGYTVYINKNLLYEQKKKAYRHAVSHVERMDFEKHDVQGIESEAHK